MIYIGNDHAACDLKNIIAEHLQKKGFEFVDCGVADGEKCDYPDMAKTVCKQIKEGDKGILICGTGIGMAMAANKVENIRAASVSDTYSAKMTRSHNNANVLCLGGRVCGSGLALDIVDIFMTTEFEGGRHQTRIDKI